MNNLHIYAQEVQHGESFIIGDVEGLKALRDAIDKALVGDCGATESIANDGEGYDTFVLRMEKAEFDKLARPYTDESAQFYREDDIFPWTIDKVREKRVLFQKERDEFWEAKKKEFLLKFHNKMNARRGELIHKYLMGTLTAEETAEYEILQSASQSIVEAAFPFFNQEDGHYERALEELLKKEIK